MKKVFTYFAALSVLLLSCNKDDETLPLSTLSGTYEWAMENTDTGIWHVSQYIFHEDGSFTHHVLQRTALSDGQLGISYSSSGTYTLRGEEFGSTTLKNFGVNYEEYPDGYAPSLEQLEEMEVNSTFAESKGTLKQLDNGSSISLLFECNDVLAMCIGEQVFQRVD